MYVQNFVSTDYVIQKERNYHIYCTRLVWNEKRKICQARCKIANQNEEKFVWSDDRPFFGLGPLFDPLLCWGTLKGPSYNENVKVKEVAMTTQCRWAVPRGHSNHAVIFYNVYHGRVFCRKARPVNSVSFWKHPETSADHTGKGRQ